MYLLCLTLPCIMAFLVVVVAFDIWLIKVRFVNLLLWMKKLLLREVFISSLHPYHKSKVFLFGGSSIALDSPFLLEVVMPQPLKVRLELLTINNNQECLPWGWETINNGLNEIIFIHHYSNVSKLISYLRHLCEEGGHCLVLLHL